MIEIRKTDMRHAGHEHFAYVLQVKNNVNRYDRQAQHAEFDQVRQWAWTTWGASNERDHWLNMRDADRFPVNTYWCWHTQFYELKIYLATDKEANWAKLKWN